MSDRTGSVASHSKLSLDSDRVAVPAADVQRVIEMILEYAGCSSSVAREVADHLIDTELCGVESHGVMRVMQYADQFTKGVMNSSAEAVIVKNDRSGDEVDGRGGIGIPAMRLAVDHCVSLAKERGIAALPVRHVGHTGRLGAYAERAAHEGFLVIIIGGGGRQNWRQVTPYGGRKALLPTNPFCFGIPGGQQGPVIVDFATSIIAGGWLYAARAAGAKVPFGSIMNRDGALSDDPADYFNGGAILPKGGAMGYGLAVMAELICEAMLGPVTTEVNWFVIAVDAGRYREHHVMMSVAEEILAEIRDCPPADGVKRVEVPGERERRHRDDNLDRMIALPQLTWTAMRERAARASV
ncbi:MAG: Ldh family oxidoreductase [Alphaproteobacteria bacterium]